MGNDVGQNWNRKVGNTIFKIWFSISRGEKFQSTSRIEVVLKVQTRKLTVNNF